MNQLFAAPWDKVFTGSLYYNLKSGQLGLEAFRYDSKFTNSWLTLIVNMYVYLFLQIFKCILYIYSNSKTRVLKIEGKIQHL